MDTKVDRRTHMIRPFAGLRPPPEHAAHVAAPPYDVLNTAEARVRAAGRPWSFLHISKPEIDLAEGTDPYAPEVYARAAENLKQMLEHGILRRDLKPCYYAYRLTMGEHEQIGLVAAASVAEYDRNRIRRHELTRPEKEDDRVRQIEALNAQTGPVMIAYPPAPEVDAVLEQAAQGVPDADVTASDGVRHTIWVIEDRSAIQALTRAFDFMPALYIADGHHRSAAASRVATARRSAHQGQMDGESYDYFLAVIFPHHRMRILEYNRVVADLNDMTRDALLACLRELFDVEPSINAVAPAKSTEFGLYVAGQWHRLTLRPAFIPTHDPIARLDVSLLSKHVLEPLLGIKDLRRDKRIDFVGGIRGLAELEKRVDSGQTAAAFTLYPTPMAELMAVADSGRMMPPKSTWFEPKLADGLVSYVLD